MFHSLQLPLPRNCHFYKEKDPPQCSIKKCFGSNIHHRSPRGRRAHEEAWSEVLKLGKAVSLDRRPSSPPLSDRVLLKRGAMTSPPNTHTHGAAYLGSSPGIPPSRLHWLVRTGGPAPLPAAGPGGPPSICPGGSGDWPRGPPPRKLRRACVGCALGVGEARHRVRGRRRPGQRARPPLVTPAARLLGRAGPARPWSPTTSSPTSPWSSTT